MRDEKIALVITCRGIIVLMVDWDIAPAIEYQSNRRTYGMQLGLLNESMTE